jgi:hypothetical protein
MTLTLSIIELGQLDASVLVGVEPRKTSLAFDLLTGEHAVLVGIKQSEAARHCVLVQGAALGGVRLQFRAIQLAIVVAVDQRKLLRKTRRQRGFLDTELLVLIEIKTLHSSSVFGTGEGEIAGQQQAGSNDECETGVHGQLLLGCPAYNALAATRLTTPV